MQYKIGDTVMLKGGGFIMTITKIGKKGKYIAPDKIFNLSSEDMDGTFEKVVTNGEKDKPLPNGKVKCEWHSRSGKLESAEFDVDAIKLTTLEGQQTKNFASSN